MTATDDPRRARSRRRLLDAAAELLATGGTSAVTVEAVTSLSGVARTTLYRNFSSSHALVAAAFGELLPRVELAEGPGTAAERMLALFRRQYALLQVAPLQDSLLAWLAMGLVAEDHPDHRPDDEFGALRREVADLYLEPVRTLLDEAIAAGDVAAEERNSALARLVGPAVVSRLVGLPALTDDEIAGIVHGVMGSP